MSFWIIAKRELKLGFRNPWAYSFLVIFTLFSFALFLIQSQQVFEINGYTHTSGTMLKLVLYLLPLISLLLGSFSLTSEKEEGGWQLLATYPLSTTALFIGKYLGLAVVLLSIVAFSFGLSGFLAAMLGQMVTLWMIGLFLLFSCGIVLLYLGISMWVGSLCKDRWQALTYCVAIWFVTVLAWPILLIAVLNWLPYVMIKPAIEALTLLNPAELVRIFTVIKIGGGSVFGPEYYQLVHWIKSPVGTIIFLLGCIVWIGATVGISIFTWERGRYGG